MTAGDARRPTPTALVAEDEPMLADELCEQLAEVWPELRIVARAADGIRAMQVIQTESPDIAFLDIHMPRLSGIEVARQAGRRCHVVFITAHDEHAIEAFEAGAIDYVLKPIGTARLMATVQRLQERLRQPPGDLTRLLERLGRNGAAEPVRHLQWINATRGNATRLITVDEIVYFKADNKWTLVVTGDAEALIKKTIRELADELDPTMFWQVHRSTIVNVHAIDTVVRDDRGGLSLRLKSRREALPVAEPYRFLFRQM